MIAAIIWIANAIGFILIQFFPFLIKKFGVGAVKIGIQKGISVLLVLTSISFYGLVLTFISETYTVFKSFIVILNNPMSSVSGGQASEAFGCFLNLLHASGIASGFNSAFSVLVSILIFFFTNMAYRSTIRVMKVVSEEVNKSLVLV